MSAQRQNVANAKGAGAGIALRCWRRLLFVGAALVMLLGLAPGAWAQCSNLTVTLSPATTSISFPSSTTGTVWSGSITVVGTNCTTAAYGGGHWLTVPIGTAAQATTVSGISVIRTGAPTYAVLSGTCVVQYVSSIWTNTEATSIGFAGPSGFCSTTMTVPFAFVKAAGTVSGTINPGQLVAAANSVFGIGMSAWAGSVDYGGANPMKLGSPSSGVTFKSTGTCTVSAAVTTVVLPTVSTTALPSAGATAGRTPFTLTLTGCTYPGAAYAANATWTFAPALSATVIGNSAASPKAANVGVQLLNANLTPISDGSTTTLASVSATGSYSTSFFAQYYATGVAGAGNVAGQATFTLTYQ